MKICKVEGCLKKTIAHGLMCGMHYARISKHGDPNIPTVFDKRPAIIEGDIAKIPLGVLAKYGYAIVDKEFAWLDKMKRCITKSGHVFTGKSRLIHRIILGIENTEKIADHIDRNPLNNRLSNLRIANKSLNSINRGLGPLNTTGFKGVSYNKKRKYYESYITINNNRIRLGYYKTLEEAVVVRKQAELKYFGFIVEY